MKRVVKHQTYVEMYQLSLDENITHALPTISQAAMAALQQFCARYYAPPCTVPPLITKYLGSVQMVVGLVDLLE